MKPHDRISLGHGRPHIVDMKMVLALILYVHRRWYHASMRGGRGISSWRPVARSVEDEGGGNRRRRKWERVDHPAVTSSGLAEAVGKNRAGRLSLPTAVSFNPGEPTGLASCRRQHLATDGLWRFKAFEPCHLFSSHLVLPSPSTSHRTCVLIALLSFLVFSPSQSCHHPRFSRVAPLVFAARLVKPRSANRQ